MDAADILARYDAEMRADPPPAKLVERAWVDGVLRSTVRGHNFIIWWDFPAERAAEIAAREAAFFADRPLEWYVYSHDRPAGLEAELAAAGFTGAAPVTFVVLDMDASFPPFDPPPGVEVREVKDAAGLADFWAVTTAAFDGPPPPWLLEASASRLDDPTQALFVAYEGGRPISSGRLELAPGKAFGGLYSGGTVPAQQGRGVYRALVGARAAEARRRGCRYLTVDAEETSRPILERLAFQPLASVRTWSLGAAT